MEKSKIKKIAVEEHFTTPAHMDLIRAIYEKNYSKPEVLAREKYISSDVPFIDRMDVPRIRKIVDNLFDTGAGRLRLMDQAGIDMQILSLSSPGGTGLR